MSMEEDEYSINSNTDAIVCGVSDPSRSDESMISDPNISSSSSDDDISHQQQKQHQILTIVVAAGGDGTNDLTVSSCASSSWFMDNSNKNNKQIEQKAVMIFNVDFGELFRIVVDNSCDNEERLNLNSCRGNEPIEDILSSSFSFWEWKAEDYEGINEIVLTPLSPINWSSPEGEDDDVNFDWFDVFLGDIEKSHFV